MNLKNLCSLVLLAPTLAWSQSSSSKTVLFLDMNNNPKEIEVAKRSAIARGETLVVIPKKKTSKKDEFVAYNIKAELEEALAKNTVSSLVLSGHNGGDSYSGNNGGISAPDLMEILEKSSSHKEIKSLYLLGCNSANKSKIFFWKASLPELKFIAGYDGTAPLGHLANGLGYFEDAMKKEKSIIQSSDAAKIKTLFESLKYVNTFQASVYACDPQDVGHLFMSGRKGKERFGVLDTSECVQKLQEFQKKYLTELRDYWGAKKEPTDLNPSSGILKDAYVFMRQNEHCISGENHDGIVADFNGDNLLFLRFNKDFNENFVNYYKPLLEKTKADLDLMASDPSLYYDKMKEETDKAKSEYEKIHSDPAKEKALIADEIKHIQKQKDKILADNPGMRQCLETPTPQCQRFRSVFVNYSDLEMQAYFLKDTTMLDFVLFNAQAPSKEDFLSTLQELKPKERAEQIQKMLDNPQKVKRSEILDLTHHLSSLPDHGSSESLKMALKGYERMSGDVYPFSWHEVSEDKKVEEPFSRKHQINLLSGSVPYAKNRELEYIMKKITAID